MPRLICKSGLEDGVFFDLRLGLNRLGRLPGNHFLVEHVTVSSTHCEITWLDGGIVVKDCRSTNGTFIDDVQIAEGKLQTGQILRLGEVEFLLDSAEARVSVPDLKAGIVSRPTALADGSIPCTNHHQIPATSRCTKCKREYCAACVHELHRAGGKTLRLCPECSGPMEFLPGQGPLKLKKKSFLSRIKQTLKIKQ
ncbi:MAG TPA: FHA domain-containing protein [Candidatus Saccharimonadales bacterium]|nr:FHA domain-containing protein [Candidatus Saccharimonadales bacterium]